MLRYGLLLGLLFSCIVAVASPCIVPVAVIQEVKLQGNEVTKDFVLLRELTFNIGDSVQTENLENLLEENRKRIYNLRLFHAVNYSYTCDNGQVVVTYQVKERAYLFPIPIFDFADRNFNAWLEKKDLRRIDYGFMLTRRNFRGRNEDVRLRLQHGFNRRIELSYRVPYLAGSQNLGYEVSVADYRSHTISYDIRNNRQYFYEQEEGMPIKRTGIGAAVIHRQSVQRQSALRLSYYYEEVSDTISKLNPDYFNTNYTNRNYIRLDLTRVINQRNTFAYPLSGSYFDIGIGHAFFLNNTGTGFTTARAKYVNYSALPHRFYYTIGAEVQARLGSNFAVTDNTALGYRSLVRGYELYVVGGQHYGLFKQGFSKELFNLKGIHLKFIRNPKLNTIPLALYLNAFTDAGYTIDNTYGDQNPLTNRLLIGGGIGVHVVTFYDIVLRGEYTANREGNRGLYLNMGYPF
ncbi:POTRA domain-containing protein [Pontibacter populi]|uniref:POTRA domain-containing protein n=1 Tax=Pontibacter populi TaxID=890055 RepID=A0ABV1RUB3_9BACT